MRIELPIKNFPAQETIFNDPHRFKVVAKGRRFGLTKGGANDFIKGGIKRTFKKGIWVDVINQNIDRYVLRYFLPSLRRLDSSLWQWKKQERTLYILDSYIDFRSADRPESLEGFGYDKAFLNEAGIILKDEYLWNNAIRPMLVELKPQTVIGGTPKAGTRLFQDLYNRGLDPNSKLYKSFHFTTYDNPYLDKAEIDAMVAEMPELVSQQEIFANFISDQGAVFRGVKEIMTSIAREPQPGHLYVMGLDLAKVQDYTVMKIYDRRDNSEVYTERFNKIEWPFQKAKIVAVAKKYNNAYVQIDATGIGDPIADDLTRSGLSVNPIHLTNEVKKELIEKLVIWIEQKRIRMLPDDVTLREHVSFTYDVSATGKIRYNAPIGMHDDTVIANALAVRELFEVVKEEAEEPTLIQQEIKRRLRGQSLDENEYVEI